MLRSCIPPGDDRQHRDPRTGIFVATIERKRPEMRWRPQEDDQEQDKRFKAYLSRGGRPADHWRKCAGGAADDDVLWRPPLQPNRVHGVVEEDRKSKQARCFQVYDKRKDGDCATGKSKSKCQRFST